MNQELVWTLKVIEGLLNSGIRLEGDTPCRGVSTPIEELHIELTRRCNLRCIMCHYWKMPFTDPSSVKREMSLHDIRRIVKESKLLSNVKKIVITGGEPWLRKDMVDITAFLASCYPKASIWVLPNFFDADIIRRKLQELEARGVRLKLGSSLDGMQKVHDTIRGRRGAFQGLIRTVEMLRREFPAIKFNFLFTITPKNYREIWPVYRFAAGMGLWFIAQMVVNDRKFKAPEVFQWKNAELREIEKQIDLVMQDICAREGCLSRLLKGREKESAGLMSYLLYWEYLKKYIRKPERFFKNCMTGRRYAVLDPEGNLFFCPVNSHRTIGNVRDKAFDEVWTSKKAQSERNYIESRRCHCWLQCIANPILDKFIRYGIEASNRQRKYLSGKITALSASTKIPTKSALNLTGS